MSLVSLIIEPMRLRAQYLGLNCKDKRRQRHYHRKSAQWWLSQVPFTKGCKRLAKLHLRDARNG